MFSAPALRPDPHLSKAREQIMQQPIRVIRLHENGDPKDGMSPWEPIAHDKVLEGTPRQRRHRFFVSDRLRAGQVRVGIWQATAYTERLENYPKDEFMYVIEGSVTIIEPDGRTETFTKGDSFFMPCGFAGLWQQDEPMKKYFMVFDAYDSDD